MKRAAILTGGGDVPGLNAAIRSFVWRMEEAGWDVVGLRRGWDSLIHIIPDKSADNTEWAKPVNRANTRTIDRTGGTVLHTSRTNPSLLRANHLPEHLKGRTWPVDDHGRLDLTRAALESLEFLEVDALVAVGGDGTLSFARRLHEEGVPIVAVPKTMDNDVFGTDYCIGFSSAVTRSIGFINDLRTAAGSHERFLIVELFGRYSGETCLLASYLASTDRAVIAEVPFDEAHLFELLMEDKVDNPSHYAVLAISEGAFPRGGRLVESGEPDVAGQRKLGGIGQWVADSIEKRTGERAIYQRLAYLMRSGVPDSVDLLVANAFGSLAAGLVLEGTTGRLVAIVDGRYAAVPLSVTGEGIKRVDVQRFYDSVNYRPRVTDLMGLPMFLH